MVEGGWNWVGVVLVSVVERWLIVPVCQLAADSNCLD